MVHAPDKPQARDEVWFFVSEIAGQRAGGFRQERWCEVFLSLGAQVRVYNVPDAGALRLTEAQFGTAAELKEFRRKAMSDSSPRAAIREGLLVRLLRRLKHLFLVDLYYPNVLRLIWRAHRRLKAGGNPVVIMCSSPPFSLPLAGAVLKALHGSHVVLVVDMRDPWTFHKSLGGIRPLKVWLEGKVLRRADYLCTVSRGLNEEFAQYHGVSMEVLYNIASHYGGDFEAERFTWTDLDAAIAPDRVKLVFTGSTPETYYDLAALAGGIMELRAANPAAADRLQIIFVGACQEMKRELLRRGHRGNDVVFVPHVSQRMARSIQQHSDVLLFLTYLGRGAVSTKIFEYLALGKPILPVSVLKGSDADYLFSEFCGKCQYLHTASEIAQGLLQAASADAASSLPRLLDPASLRPLLDAYKAFGQRIMSGK
jgi:glycosyltransferase involved in cell wall biosynthesis